MAAKLPTPEPPVSVKSGPSPPSGNGAVEKVPVREKAAIGVGSLVDNLCGTGVHQLANPVYNILLGVNPAVIGGILAVGRLIDAVLDPAIGTFSDNFRSRFGRRRPLIAFGAIVTGPLFLAMFFCPLGWSTTAYSIYFSVTVLFFYIGFTFHTGVAIRVEFQTDRPIPALFEMTEWV